MTRQFFISFFFLQWTIMMVLTGFKTRTNGENITGTYSSKIAFLHDMTTSELTIKKNLRFEELIESTGNYYKNKSTRTGKWVLKNDTLFLIPLHIKTIKKTSLIRITRTKETSNCTSDKNKLLCKADTFIFKDNAFWTIQSPTYKAYTKK